MGSFIKDLPLDHTEADFGDGPVQVHWRKMSLYELDKVDKASEIGVFYGIVECLFLRARTAENTRLFPAKDREAVFDKIYKQYDPDEVGRVVALMNPKKKPKEVDPETGED